MPRYIAIYKGYDSTAGLQQGKDYCLIAHKDSGKQINITIQDSTGTPIGSLVYSSDWEFLRDWQILRTWARNKNK